MPTYLTPFDHPNSYRNLWIDSAIADRIDHGIETHRKSDAVVRVVDAAGQPVAGAPVRVRQRDSAFHFGANIFKLGDFPTDELNERYEQAFLGLFNAATVPFYWKTLEPEPGRVRFTADSERIPRRPPPDVVVDFCQKHGLRMHGHTLVWSWHNWMIPDWLDEDMANNERLWEKRVREIAERYGSVIKRWDVVNEARNGGVPPNTHPMPEDYERKAFEWAATYFPEDVRFDLNETSGYWYPHKRAYANLIRDLLDGGAKLDAIGMQFHLFTDREMARMTLGELHPPRDLFDALDLYAGFGLPIHVSEITLTSPDKSEQGLAAQADVATNLYKLWFSHPAVEGITWWNVPDGGAAPGEDTVYSGLLFDDMTPKPSYEALRRLLHEEWRTDTSGTTDAEGNFHFRGFQGGYDVDAAGHTDQSLNLKPGETAALTLHEDR